MEENTTNEDKFILPYFSAQQKWIIEQRLDNTPYSVICNTWNFSSSNANSKVGANLRKKENPTLYNQNITNCIRRSALGYFWEKGMPGGNDSYLCPDDLNNLKEQVLAAAHEGSPYDTSLIIDKALELKKARYSFAFEFLQATHGEALLSEFHEKQLQEKAPSRPWINGILKDIDASIRNKHFIDIFRLIASTPENIKKYFNVAAEIIARYHPFLIFGADDTMLFPSMRRKIVVPNEIKQEFLEASLTLPHFTAMCSHNIYGKSFVPFIILPNLKHIPEDLREFADRGDAVFASSRSGWQTKETFLYWVICFINNLSCYRNDLKDDLKDKRALLIIDGHKSRENAYALQLLQEAKIYVLTIPSHTSHILQMFDVAIASPLKRTFSDKFNAGIKYIKSGNMASQYRVLAITSFLTAWSSACTYNNCQAGAIATGTYPCNVDVALKSIFVTPLNPRYADRARIHQEFIDSTININGRIINDTDFLKSLDEYLSKSKNQEYCQLQESINYQESVKKISELQENDCYLLSSFPKLIDNDGKVVKFTN